MSKTWLEKLIISDDDISWVESVLGNDISFDDERKAVIKALKSVDIQAFPGSGKTTALVAKLAILARKWSEYHSGICVLSHTNAARLEIEKRVGRSDVGSKLLNYPHFIGTIHNFINVYIALPWLRSKGFPINIIDNEYAKKYRWFKLGYRATKYLSEKYRNKKENLCCFNKKLGEIDTNLKSEYKEKIIQSIYDSHKKGFFTYDEMLLYGKQALTECNIIPEIIQNRFPLVFIDEAQDTSSLQWELIHSIFPDGSIIQQNFGDYNQAIFNSLSESEKTRSPEKMLLTISDSKRFDNKIATLANTIAVTGERMKGTPNEFSRPDKKITNTIFLFERNRDSSRKVIDEFGKLVVSTFSDQEIIDNDDKGIQIIGMIHHKRGEENKDHFPKYICDYWTDYDPGKGRNVDNPRSLIFYYRQGLSNFRATGEMNDFISIILKGIKQLAFRANKGKSTPNLEKSLFSIFREKGIEPYLTFRNFLMDITSVKKMSESDWNVLIGQLNNVLKLIDCLPNKNTAEFLKWENSSVSEEPSCLGRIEAAGNIYHYTNKTLGRSVQMKFGSIHSAKGRTHLATLVLETFYLTHNFKVLVPLLCGEKVAKKSNLFERRQKIHYVAFTRAKALLCIAIPTENSAQP